MLHCPNVVTVLLTVTIDHLGIMINHGNCHNSRAAGPGPGKNIFFDWTIKLGIDKVCFCGKYVLPKIRWCKSSWWSAGPWAGTKSTNQPGQPIQAYYWSDT